MTRGESEGFFSPGQIRVDLLDSLALVARTGMHPTTIAIMTRRAQTAHRAWAPGCTCLAGQECRSCGFADYEPCPCVLSPSDGLNVSNVTSGTDMIFVSNVNDTGNVNDTEFGMEAAPIVPVERTQYVLPSPEESPLTYEACVGTTPFGCQLQNFAQTQSNESWTSADGLQPRCSNNMHHHTRHQLCRPAAYNCLKCTKL